ncbi:DMT family transporter [Micromonospora sp. CA-111912]|uniref:DMT family transporter n=1 Tax=Micromonospora sp. CA-111912 TaxID=3239955 RepID=UPI003D90B4D6
MAWILLLGAIAFEVTGTSALKHSAGFTKLVPTIVVGVAYLLSFTLLALAVRHLQVSVAYAIWSGVGTAAIAIVARIAFGEALTPAKIAGIALIIAGVATLNLAGAE